MPVTSSKDSKDLSPDVAAQVCSDQRVLIEPGMTPKKPLLFSPGDELSLSCRSIKFGVGRAFKKPLVLTCVGVS